MSAEQQPGILPRVQDNATYTSPPDSIPAPNIARRPRACVACKESKVRCKRDETRPEDSCERCAGAGRHCILSASARTRRPRRNISAVASLESKVDALVAALKEKQAGDIEEHKVASPVGPMLGSHVQSMHTAPRSSALHENLDADQGASSSAAAKCNQKKRKRTLQAEHQYSFAFFLPRPSQLDKDPQEDVIDQGLISLEEAEECFVRFTEVMLPHFPVVVFPHGTTASNLRRTRPLLFLAILGAASGHLGDAIRKMLVEEVMRTYADRMFMSGHRNLDLVQAIQVSAVWYFPPERFDEVKVYQLIHMAALLAIELDFLRPARSSTSRLSLHKDAEVGPPPLGPFHPKELQLECQRALLCSYILCGIPSMITRRPNLMRWAPYMNEYIEALEKPSVAVISDLFLCQWVRSQQIAEEVGQHFFMDDPSANVDISDLSVQYTLRGYEQQFDRWKAQIPPDFLLRPTLQSEASMLNLYLHEIFLRDGQIIQEFAAAPFTEENPAPVGGIKSQTLSVTHRRALAICIASVKNLFDIFLSLDTDTLCSIPVFHYLRTAYTVFTMMKIHFATRSFDSGLHEMMDNDLNVEFYLDELLKSLQEVSWTRKLRVAAIFSLVLLVLRTWFQRQKSQIDPGRMHGGPDDTIFQTVLQTADSINADGNVHDCNARAHETAAAHSSFHVQPMAESAVPPGIDEWPSGLDEEMLPWNEFDLGPLWDADDSILLQITLERLGGLIG